MKFYRKMFLNCCSLLVNFAILWLCITICQSNSEQSTPTQTSTATTSTRTTTTTKVTQTTTTAQTTTTTQTTTRYTSILPPNRCAQVCSFYYICAQPLHCQVDHCSDNGSCFKYCAKCIAHDNSVVSSICRNNNCNSSSKAIKLSLEIAFLANFFAFFCLNFKSYL